LQTHKQVIFSAFSNEGIANNKSDIDPFTLSIKLVFRQSSQIIAAMLGTSCWRGDLSVTAGLCERKPLETATGYPEPCGVC
jgi:hypothetical protein